MASSPRWLACESVPFESGPFENVSACGNAMGCAGDPFGQAPDLEAQARPLPGGQRAQVGLQEAILQLQQGNPVSPNIHASMLINQIITNAGYGSAEELFRAEREYQAQVAKQNEQFQDIAGLSAERRGLVERALTNMARQPLDLNSLRAAELTRLSRQLDERQTETLRAAATGGYNPGGALQKIEQLRSDADLDALTRAVGYLSGQAQSISNLSALNPANRAQSLSPSVLQFRQPSLTGAPQYIQGQANPFGAAVAGASNQLGGTVSSLGLLQLLNNTNTAKPAFNPAAGGFDA